MENNKNSEILLKEKRFEIYEEMLEIAKEDLLFSEGWGFQIGGFCWILHKIGLSSSILKELPELMNYKPIKTKDCDFWFSVDPKGKERNKRIEILKEILSTK
jgi:hypothetical protein